MFANKDHRIPGFLTITLYTNTKWLSMFWIKTYKQNLTESPDKGQVQVTMFLECNLKEMCNVPPRELEALVKLLK